MTLPPELARLPYRQCVGICLFNNNGLVLVAERRDHPGSWQMPQGGINKGEEPRAAVLREMKEELGTANAEIIAEAPTPLAYDFPEGMQKRHGHFHGKYRGQKQYWFALRYLGQDTDITLDQNEPPELPEFVRWKWVPIEETANMIVGFKKPVYVDVVKIFKPVADRLREGLPVTA